MACYMYGPWFSSFHVVNDFSELDAIIAEIELPQHNVLSVEEAEQDPGDV